MRTSSALILLVFLAHAALAQSSRMNRVVCAEVAPICARANVQREETKIERSVRETRKQETLWSVPRWLNIVRIDEDGVNLLVEVESTSDLRQGISKDSVLLALYRSGKLLREISAGDLAPTPEELELLMRAPAWAKRLPSAELHVARYLLATGRTVRVMLSNASVAYE